VIFGGGCHCGALGFAFVTDKPPRDWSIRACQCSFCRAHAALSTSDPAGTIQFVEREAGRLAVYQFGTRTADFLICGRCGVYVGARMQAPEGRFAIINVRALAPMPADLPEAQAMNYDGESSQGRAERRARRWSRLVEAPTSLQAPPD
jgi:hypothetical protein